MGLFDIFKKKVDQSKADTPAYLYSESELNEVDDYICKAIGKYDNVFHEINSPDIHLDICMVPPTEDEPYHKLVTMGAGAYSMNIPEQWRKYSLDRAEYIIYLPKDWNLQSSAETDYWPIKVLKDTARLPIWCNTWLSYGHTLQGDEEGKAYAPNTGFNSVVLDFAENKNGDVRLTTTSGKTINFYEIIPLYPEELKFKMDNDAEKLLDLINGKGIQYKVVDINRKNACI